MSTIFKFAFNRGSTGEYIIPQPLLACTNVNGITRYMRPDSPNPANMIPQLKGDYVCYIAAVSRLIFYPVYSVDSKDAMKCCARIGKNINCNGSEYDWQKIRHDVQAFFHYVQSPASKERYVKLLGCLRATSLFRDAGENCHNPIYLDRFLDAVERKEVELTVISASAFFRSVPTAPIQPMIIPRAPTAKVKTSAPNMVHSSGSQWDMSQMMANMIAAAMKQDPAMASSPQFMASLMSAFKELQQVPKGVPIEDQSDSSPNTPIRTTSPSSIKEEESENPKKPVSLLTALRDVKQIVGNSSQLILPLLIDLHGLKDNEQVIALLVYVDEADHTINDKYELDGVSKYEKFRMIKGKGKIPSRCCFFHYIVHVSPFYSKYQSMVGRWFSSLSVSSQFFGSKLQGFDAWNPLGVKQTLSQWNKIGYKNHESMYETLSFKEEQAQEQANQSDQSYEMDDFETALGENSYKADEWRVSFRDALGELCWEECNDIDCIEIDFICPHKCAPPKERNDDIKAIIRADVKTPYGLRIKFDGLTRNQHTLWGSNPLTYKPLYDAINETVQSNWPDLPVEVRHTHHFDTSFFESPEDVKKMLKTHYLGIDYGTDPWIMCTDFLVVGVSKYTTAADIKSEDAWMLLRFYSACKSIRELNSISIPVRYSWIKERSFADALPNPNDIFAIIKYCDTWIELQNPEFREKKIKPELENIRGRLTDKYALESMRLTEVETLKNEFVMWSTLANQPGQAEFFISNYYEEAVFRYHETRAGVLMWRQKADTIMKHSGKQAKLRKSLIDQSEEVAHKLDEAERLQRRKDDEETVRKLKLKLKFRPEMDPMHGIDFHKATVDAMTVKRNARNKRKQNFE